jgi:hypothetical protein
MLGGTPKNQGKESSVRSAVTNNSGAISMGDSSAKGVQHAVLGAGSVLGLDAFFLRSSDVFLRKCVVRAIPTC